MKLLGRRARQGNNPICHLGEPGATVAEAAFSELGAVGIQHADAQLTPAKQFRLSSIAIVSPVFRPEVEPPRCPPIPVLVLGGGDSPRGIHRSHPPGHGSPHVLAAQGAIGCSRQVGPVQTAWPNQSWITMKGTAAIRIRQRRMPCIHRTIFSVYLPIPQR